MKLVGSLRRRGFVACLGLIVVLGALPAAASQPVKIPFNNISIDFPTAFQCSYGYLDATATFNGFDLLYFDSAGNLTGNYEHAVVTSVITNPLNGKTARGSNTQNEINTYQGGSPSGTIEGLTLQLSLPDGSTVRLAGRYIVDFNTGAITFQTPLALDRSYVPALCAALQ